MASKMSSKDRRKTIVVESGLARPKKRKAVPYEFVLEAMGRVPHWTRSMFGSLAIYVEDKIVLILREKGEESPDNGVWIATTAEHHESLRQEFPNMRSIEIFGTGVTGWQVLPASAADFEEAALRVCELIAARDRRIGKVPKKRKAGKKTVTRA